MERIRNQKVPTLLVVKCLLAGYVITGGLLFLLAFILYQFQVSAEIVSIGIVIIYCISNFLIGFFIGKKMESRKFLWGLCIGVLYFIVLAVISVCMNQEFKDMGSNFLTSFLLCAGSGMLGGMLS
ncbi:MAG: TIGR04086 family membrane protein [Eubacteriales bacterium]